MNTLAVRRSRSVSRLALFGLLVVAVIGLSAPAAVAAAAPDTGFRALSASRVTMTFVDSKTRRAPTTSTLKKGQRLDFTATIKPFFTNVPGHVRWEVWGTRGGRFQVLIKATSDPDAINPTHLGQAGFDVTFNQTGRYAVRAMATATSAALASAWTPMRFFNVR